MKKTKNNLITIVVLGIVVASLLVGGTGVASFRAVMNEHNHEILLHLCKENKESMNNRLRSIETQVNTLEDYYLDHLPSPEALSDESFVNSYTQETGEIGYSLIRNNKSVAAVYLRFNAELAGTKAGFFISRTAKSSEPEYLETTDLYKYGREDTDAAGWYYIPKDKGEPVWIGPYHNPNNGIFMISYVRPMYKDGTFVGVVGMDIDYRIISREIDEIKVYDTGYAVVLDNEGELSYAGDHSPLIPKELSTAITEDDEEYVFSSYTRKQLMYITVSSRLYNGDYLVLLAPESEIYSARNKLVFTIILIAVAVSSLIILILTGMVNRILSASHIDNLTDAMNRNAYLERVYSLEDSIHSGKKVSYAVVIFDINSLKAVNDTIGHAAGDKMIRNSYDVIKKHFPSDNVYRTGGDEFVVLIEKKTCEIAVKLAEEFRNAMAERGREICTMPDEPAISCGYAVYDPTVDASYEDTFNRADESMYDDKQAFYSSNPQMKRRI